MVGVDTSAGGVFVAVWETILSAESQSKQGNVRDTPFPQHPDGCDVAARARLQVVAPTAEVVAFTTAQHAVATLHSVAARFGCVKANIHVGDSLSRCCKIVLFFLQRNKSPLRENKTNVNCDGGALPQRSSTLGK